MVPAIQVERLSKSYNGTRALDAVTLDLPAGRMVGVIGPTAWESPGDKDVQEPGASVRAHSARQRSFASAKACRARSML